MLFGVRPVPLSPFHGAEPRTHRLFSGVAVCCLLFGSQARLGVVECASHDLLSSYPVVFAQRGAKVAHFRFTVLLLPSGTSKVRSAFCVSFRPRISVASCGSASGFF